jgi:hypothetical protein
MIDKGLSQARRYRPTCFTAGGNEKMRAPPLREPTRQGATGSGGGVRNAAGDGQRRRLAQARCGLRLVGRGRLQQDEKLRCE